MKLELYSRIARRYPREKEVGNERSKQAIEAPGWHLGVGQKEELGIDEARMRRTMAAEER